MGARRVSMRRALPGTVLLLLLAGCGGNAARGVAATGASSGGAPVSSPSPKPSDDAGCGGAAIGGQPVKFGPAGAANLAGVVFGTGPTGMVLAHQSRADRCQWAAYARESAKAGYRVMTFDFPGSGDSPAGLGNDAAVAAAVAYLRGLGTQIVVLIGASMGGNAVLAATPQIAPPVAGVISLSAPAVFQGLDAAAAAKVLAVPVLYAACQNDSGFAEDAAALYAATPSTHPHKLLVAPGCSSHGVELADPSGGPEAVSVRAAMRDFLAAYAPA